VKESDKSTQKEIKKKKTNKKYDLTQKKQKNLYNLLHQYFFFLKFTNPKYFSLTQ
jgi:hypothetical protein